MNMKYNDKTRIKSKTLSGGNKKPNRSSFEAIKVTLEKKKQCNSKALEIVTEFSEGTISDGCFIENLHFINQEHYQDIVEERAINKLCGYPLCSSELKSIPAKQYHISTIHNKVFDITDRKNFCSNLCFKASKYVKDQIQTSPVWLREPHSPATYKLISLQSTGGVAGDEVDLGLTSVKGVLDEILSYDDKKCVMKHDKAVETELDSTATAADDALSGGTSRCTSQQTDIDEETTDGKLRFSKSTSLSSGNDSLNELSSDKNNSSNADLSKDIEILKVKIYANEKPTTSSMPVTSSDNVSCVEGNTLVVVSSDLKTDRLSKGNVNSKNIDKSVTTAMKETRVTPQKSISKFERSLQRKSGKKNVRCSMESVVKKVEQVLREWFSMNSLCFTLGEGKVKEMLAEKKTHITKFNSVSDISVEGDFYERYLAVCRKLNVFELEDSKLDASFREEVKKPLPDYEALKEEAKTLELKVNMFFKGDKVVQFEEPQGDANNADDRLKQEPILPLVDLHAQKALRRRIVNDKLRKVLQDVQNSLGLRGFNITEDVRTLIGTFTLSAHNITMKPAEWNLITIVVIKMLALRDEVLQQALSSSYTSKHLTLLLMSYSLDGGYLDRLIVWLTDIDSILQKNE